MDLRKRNELTKGFLTALFVVAIALVLVAPQAAHANPNKAPGTACVGCHNALMESDGSQEIFVAIDGVQTNAVTVAPGGSFEIDWVYERMRGSSTTRGVASWIGGPAWTYGVTTVNPAVPTMGGHVWNTNWDDQAGKNAGDNSTWVNNGADGGGSANVPPAVAVAYVIDATNGGFHEGTGSVKDDGTTYYDDATLQGYCDTGLPDTTYNAVDNECTALESSGAITVGLCETTWGGTYSTSGGGASRQSVCSWPLTGDPDGVADVNGSDIKVTVPGGTADGTYYIYPAGVGRNAANTKGMVFQTITVTVSSGGDSTAPVPNNDVAVSVESGTNVPAAFNVTASFVDAESAVTSCEYTLNNGGAWSAGVVSGAGPYTCTANVTGQVDAATLDISMRATSGGGLSAASTYYPTRTVDAVGPVQNVGTPLAAATGASGEIDLTWGTATDAGVGLHATLPYRIRQLAGATPPNADCTSDGTEIYSGTALLHTDTGLPVSSQYSYRLCTYDLWDQLTAAGQTATATSGAGTTPPDTAISAPTASEQLSSSPYTISGTATAGTNPLQDVLVSTDGGATYPNTATGTASWTWDWTLPSEDYVAHTIMAKARDNTLLEDPSPASVAIFVDNVAPTGLSLNTPADAATGVSSTPSLTVNAATDGNPTIEYQFEVAEDSGFSVNPQTSAWQAGTSWTPAALSAGTPHFWRVTARDGAGNTTAATGTRTFTTSAGCVRSQPTVSLAPAAQTIPNDGGMVGYTVTVTNNDSACADATFTLSANDTDPSSAFYTSVLSKTSMTIASGGSDTATVTVQVIPGNDAVSNDTTVTATDSPTHDPPVVSAAVTTTVTLGGGCVGSGNNPNATAGGTLITGR